MIGTPKDIEDRDMQRRVDYANHLLVASTLTCLAMRKNHAHPYCPGCKDEPRKQALCKRLQKTVEEFLKGGG